MMVLHHHTTTIITAGSPLTYTIINRTATFNEWSDGGGGGADEKKTGSRLKEPIIWFCRKFLYSIGFIYEKYLAFTLLNAEFLILFWLHNPTPSFGSNLVMDCDPSLSLSIWDQIMT